jgi:hypothetical protein
MIAECLYSQVDDEGNEFLLLDEIIDHRKDDTAITAEEATVEPTAPRTNIMYRPPKAGKLVALGRTVQLLGSL